MITVRTLALTAILAAAFSLSSCRDFPDRPSDCVVHQCGYSWGLIGNNIWDCGEGNDSAR